MIVDELKKSFLQQAFEGKITHSLNDDTSVEESLKKIFVQKQLLIDTYKVRNEPEYKEVSETEFLFSIPKTWRWVRIGQLGVFKKGPFGSALTKSMFVKENENTVKVYEQKNAIQKDIDLGDYYITSDYFESKMKSFEIKAGDIIVSCAGTIGETYVIPNEHKKGIINQALMRMTMVDELNVDYFLKYFDYILKRISNNLSSGSAIKNIPPFDVFKQLLIPLPPIEEQQRIVNKLTELFSKLDEAKTIEEELKILKGKFPTDMKKSLLKHAFSGKLSERLSSDTNVNDLLLHIKLEKEELIKIGKITDSKKMKEIKPEEIPFDIPKEWKWVRWGELSNSIQYGLNAGAQVNGGAKLVRISDIQDNQIVWENVPYCDIKETEIPQYSLNENDILFARTGGTVGKSVVVKNIPNDVPYVFAGYLIRSNYSSEMNFKFLKYFMESSLYWEQLKNGTIGSAQPNCNGQTLSKMILPLPPIEEQQRIVDKLEQLLPLCDDIELLVTGE